MMLRKRVLSAFLGVCMSCAAFCQDNDSKSLAVLPHQFAGTAIGQAGSLIGKSYGLNLYITAWTTDQQLQDYVNILKEKGPDGLVRAMENASDVGRVSPTGFVGSGFRFARYRSTPGGGMHVVMVTNRPIGIGELYRGGRSTDYQFGIVVLDIDKNGKGTGKLAPLCKIKFDKKNELAIENYGQQPLRIANVFLQK